jgi:hypothetical protein
MFLFLGIVSLPVEGIKVEKTSVTLDNKTINENLKLHEIYYINDTFPISSINSGNHRILLEPPWDSDYGVHKDIWGIGDAWQEKTEINGESAKSSIYSWAGPGAGLAGIDVGLIHYDNFKAPVNSHYTFKFKYTMSGKISLLSYTGLLGSSAARGIVTFCYHVGDIIDKTTTTYDVMSLGGSNNGVFPYSITKSYSCEANLVKGKSYKIWATGIASAVSDGFIEAMASANHVVLNAALLNVEIEWPNHPPTPPEKPSPSNGAINVNVGTMLSWSCEDPDGDVDALKYDVYFGTDPSPDSDELVSKSQTNTFYNPPGDLNYEKKYYWKIVVMDSKGEEKSSPIWSFTTKEKESRNSISRIKNYFANDFIERLLNTYFL